MVNLLFPISTHELAENLVSIGHFEEPSCHHNSWLELQIYKKKKLRDVANVNITSGSYTFMLITSRVIL